jgi:hypothetical protein
MVLFTIKLIVAIAAGLTLYLLAAAAIRTFTRPAPPSLDEVVLRPVNFRYRCIVCGTEVTMTSAPDGDVLDAPRHCREDMQLVVEGGRW